MIIHSSAIGCSILCLNLSREIRRDMAKKYKHGVYSGNTLRASNSRYVIYDKYSYSRITSRIRFCVLDLIMFSFFKLIRAESCKISNFDFVWMFPPNPFFTCIFISTIWVYIFRYNRLYKCQSLLIRQASEGTKPSTRIPFLDKLNLGDNDVAYSLNKKGRWKVPILLKQKIMSDSISLGEATVTLVESHKLKKPSRCISYCSTGGAITRVVPKK